MYLDLLQECRLSHKPMGTLIHVIHVERISAAFSPSVATSVATTQNTWYDITMVLAGEHVEVWRGEEQVLSTDAATVLEAGSSLRFEIKPGASWSFDDTVLATADPVTTIYEYNDANDSEEMALANSGGRQALRSNAERLTKMTRPSSGSYPSAYLGDALLTFPSESVNALAAHVRGTCADWGRTITKAQTVGQTTYTAVYKYRYGDKLKLVDTDFPGETDGLRISGTVDTRNVNCARVGPGQAGKHVDGRRLAGAIRAEKTKKLPILHLEADGLDCSDLAEVFR